MYNENVKSYMDRYVSHNRYKINPYQRLKQYEYYHANPEIKERKQQIYRYKKMAEIFRNILLE